MAASATARLADFGSCTTDGHEVNEYIVTRPYRPPEVMLGLPLTAAADVWSCGCVLMELIMGAHGALGTHTLSCAQWTERD